MDSSYFLCKHDQIRVSSSTSCKTSPSYSQHLSVSTFVRTENNSACPSGCGKRCMLIWALPLVGCYAMRCPSSGSTRLVAAIVPSFSNPHVKIQSLWLKVYQNVRLEQNPNKYFKGQLSTSASNIQGSARYLQNCERSLCWRPSHGATIPFPCETLFSTPPS